MKHIPNVTLVAVDAAGENRSIDEVKATVKALEYSTRLLSFDKVLLLSNFNPDPETSVYDYIHISSFNDVGDWGKFIVFELYKYISTDYIILIHADGFIVNPELWSDDFLKYDYIGAPWPIMENSTTFVDFYGNKVRVGNSVSIRSAKLLKIPSDIKLNWNYKRKGRKRKYITHEDTFIAVKNRHLLQEQGVKFAPLSIAVRFSRETPLPENYGVEPFVFHKWKGENKKYPCFTNAKKDIFKNREKCMKKSLKETIKSTTLYISFRAWKHARRERVMCRTNREKYKSISYKQWVKDDGDNTLRLNYLLDENSIVFDIGGYHGNFAEDIYKKYKCNIYIFEPVEDFYQMIVERFKNNNKIKVFNFGLSDIDKELLISVSDDSSSVHTKSKNKEMVQLKSVRKFIKDNDIAYINLMKINIEGGEFEVLPKLIQSQLVSNIENIQVQFHTFIDDAVSKRDDIREKLSKTHKLTYDYYFIWENWELRT